MDGRIFFVDGRQLSAIRTQDLPQLTTGIVGYERGLVNVERCYKRQVAYVRLWARTYEMFVLKNDWAKIIPLLKSGALNPAVVAPGSVLAAVNQDTDLASISVWDARFYQKVYQTLQLVFTESYPTSRL